uniref:Ubiquitin-associated protein 1-like protein n=1 Tax=Lygus hesperus TaxID=30085 RepID=A0A0A9WXU6_LYGHE
MDGIPVKINEKYKPPRKLTLPACTLNRLNNVQFMSYVYDFSLETTVAEHMSRLNKISREEIEKHEAKISTEKPSPDKPKTHENGSTSNEPTMLTPVPTPISSSQGATTSLKDIFKYSDFENDTSSPFDNEELKTLNDMEELAHVLGATSVSGQNRDESLTRSANDWQQMNYGSPSQGQFYGNNINFNAISMSTSHPSLSCPVTYSSQLPMTGQYSSYQEPLQYNVSSNISTQDKHKHEDNRAPSSDDKAGNDDGDVSEIVKSLQEYLGQRKTENSHRPNPNSVKDIGSVPFSNLNDREQTMARTVGEMGFPLSRTTAAVQLFGTDESKIIEYLLLVQSFIDKGFTESQILHALEVNRGDENDTENYLKILSQIMKLGFKEEEVVNALARTSNDRDKALDILIR